MDSSSIRGNRLVLLDELYLLRQLRTMARLLKQNQNVDWESRS
ncbi:uncharacterized protein METZ01_LOCUS288457 [marine metagenome]|uniref:Uncharacterized protein n=1 Tax=marine metagenome TaxID=408172 RepID=A0A382LHB8_9ZZZZ